MSRDSEWEALVAQFLDGRIDQASLEKLEEQLQRNAGARRHLRSMASLENGLRDWAGVRAAREAWRQSAPTQPAGATGLRGRSWPVAAAIAVGGMLAGFSGSLLFAKGLLLKEPPAIRIALGNGRFEKPAALEADGVPSTYGTWGGDFVQVVAEDQGVVPPGGAKAMVRFLRADNQRSPRGEVQGVSQLWQVVDLKPVRQREGKVPLTVELGAWFNAASFVPEKGHVFGVHLTAFQGGSGLAEEAWKSPRQTALASGSRHERADGDSAGWQWVSVRVHVPAEADSLLLSVYCGEHGPQKAKRTETAVFPGQYVAGVQLHYFPEMVSVNSKPRQ
jgi:hypothetical protein